MVEQNNIVWLLIRGTKKSTASFLDILAKSAWLVSGCEETSDILSLRINL